MLREGSLCICLTAIVLDSVGKIKNYYYPLVYLEECKDKEKPRKKNRCITEEIAISYDDESNESDDESIKKDTE